MNKTESSTSQSIAYAAVGFASAVSVIALALGFVSYSQLSNLEQKNTELKSLVLELSKKVETDSGTNLNDNALSEFVMNNPETIIKSLTKFRFEQEQVAKQQESERVMSFEDAIYNDKNDPFFGNPNGKHVVVEFADYNCGYCKRLAPTLEEFVRINPEAKVIIKEYPIFQNKPSSAYSAIVGTAIFMTEPDLYEKYHHEVISQPNITVDSVDEVIAKLGLSKERLKPKFELAKTQVEKNRVLGSQLQVTGTPTLIVNGQKVGGNLSAQALMGYFN